MTNDSAKRSCRTSLSQYDTLLKFMMDHDQFAHGRLVGTMGRRRQAELWASLTNLLNGDPTGPEKAPASWQKTWADWKCNTRRKDSQLKSNRAETVGGPPPSKQLTPLEEKLVTFLGPVTISGDAGSMDEYSYEITAGTSAVVVKGEHLPENRDVITPDMPTDILTESDWEQVAPAALKRKSYFTNLQAPKKKIIEDLATSSDHLEAFVEAQNTNLEVMQKIGDAIFRIASAEERKSSAEERKACAEERKAAALEKIATLCAAFLEK